MILRWLLYGSQLEDPFIHWPEKRQLAAEHGTIRYHGEGSAVVRHASRDHREFWKMIDAREERRKFRVVQGNQSVPHAREERFERMRRIGE